MKALEIRTWVTTSTSTSNSEVGAVHVLSAPLARCDFACTTAFLAGARSN